MDLAQQRKGPDRFGLAFHLILAQVLEGEVSFPEMLRLPADDNLARLGETQEPRGEVRGVSHRRVVHAEVCADGADHHMAGVDAHPDLELNALRAAHVLAERPQALLNGQRSAEGAMRMILIGNGGAEQRHHAIPRN